MQANILRLARFAEQSLPDRHAAALELEEAFDMVTQDSVSALPATARGVAVAIRGLRKSFGAHEVLAGIDLDIGAGEFVTVVGRSGCGKSTLLRLLLGLDRPSSGRFWFGPEHAPVEGRDVARIMFQEPRLLPWARVLDNVETGLGQRRREPGARALALATLNEVGLETRRDDWPAILSGGQKQRVALARALVSKPRLMVFDEPLGAVDALTRISMQRLLEHVWQDEGFTAIMVTHDVKEALTLGDRVVVIDEGRIVLDLKVEVDRKRRRGSAQLAKLEGQILQQLFRDSVIGEDA